MRRLRASATSTNCSTRGVGGGIRILSRLLSCASSTHVNRADDSPAEVLGPFEGELCRREREKGLSGPITSLQSSVTSERTGGVIEEPVLVAIDRRGPDDGRLRELLADGNFSFALRL